MKKLRKLLIGLAGLSLSVGAAIGVGLNADKGAKEAKADSGSLMYYDVDNTDFANNGNICMLVWVFGHETQAAKYVATRSVEGGLYSYTLPTGYTGAAIIRYNPNVHPEAGGTTFWNGEELWGQVCDFNPGTTYNFLKIGSRGSGYDPKDDRGSYKYNYTPGWLQTISAGSKYYIDAQDCSTFWHSESETYHTYLYLSNNRFNYIILEIFYYSTLN